MNKQNIDTELSRFVDVVMVLEKPVLENESPTYKYYFMLFNSSFEYMYDSSYDDDKYFWTWKKAMDAGIQRLRDYHSNIVGIAEYEAKEGAKYRASKKNGN